MTRQQLYVRLGTFILLVGAALIALVIFLGTGSFLRKDITAETYFDESVQGLDVGSKVLFRGVMVGNITKLSFSYVSYEQDRPPSQRKPYVLVQFVVRPELMGAGELSGDELIRVIRGEVEKGLRVRQVPQGVTGLSYLELDYGDPKNTPSLAFDWQPKYLYVPSARSAVGRIFSATEALVRRLGSVDVEGFVTNVNALAVALTHKVDDLELDQISDEATALISDLRKSNQRLQKILGNPAWDTAPGDIASASREASAAARDGAVAAARIRKVTESEDFQKAFTQMQQTLARIDRLVAGRENDVATTLNNLRQITDNLRALSENAKRYPSGVLFGEPPKRDMRAH